ncbi:MAG: hypothetical protein PHV59_12625, partial [Victivallales bacterium]|nr:hypothetical protein [Victivallales bacterium]
MKKHFFPVILFTCLFTGIIIPNFKVYGEEEGEEFSPWAAWRNGFSYYEKGERSKEKGDHSAALTAYRKAYQCYLSVKKARPNWNQQIIGNRIRMCEREIKSLAPKVETSGTADKTRSISEQSKAVTAELEDTKAELLNYKKKLFAALIELNELRQQNKQKKNYAEQIEDLMREKRILGEEYKLLQEKYASLQNSKNQPNEVEKQLKAQLVELKVKYDILAQRLKLQEKKEEELKAEMADLYGYKSKTRNSIKEFEKVISNLKYQLEKANAAVGRESELKLKLTDQVTNLETRNQQVAANLQEKDKKIEELNKWLQQLRKGSSEQAKAQQEILKDNQLVNRKYKELKSLNDKNLQEIQQLNSLLRERNVSETKLRKDLEETTARHAALGKEYQLLNKNYSHLLVLQKENLAEIKTHKENLEKTEALVKSYSEKYKWSQEKLEKRASADLENISMLNQQNRELRKEIDAAAISNKNLKSQFDSISGKYKNLQTAFAELEQTNKSLQANARILTRETENAKALRQKIAGLNTAMKSLEQKHAKTVSANRKEFAAKLSAAEKESATLREKYQSLSAQDNKLVLAGEEISRLGKQLQDANKTIEILRNVNNAKTIADRKSGAVAAYSPQITTPQSLDPKKLLADGIKAEKNDAEELAVWNYRKYLSFKPDDSDVNRRLGTIL